MSMKYYVYISDTKVDMLYSQIPKKILDKIAVELGINLGIFSLTAKGKGNQEETRYEKLKLVVNYIENNMDVGTVDQPKAYFKGSIRRIKKKNDILNRTIQKMTKSYSP